MALRQTISSRYWILSLVISAIFTSSCARQGDRLTSTPTLNWETPKPPTSMEGGGGGDFVKSGCGPGEAVIGFYGTHGQMVYGLGAVCGLVVIDSGSGAAGPKIHIKPDGRRKMFGNDVTPAPPAYSFVCSPDAVVSYAQIDSRRFMSPPGENGPYVNYVRAGCTELHIDGQGDKLTVGFYPVSPLDPIGTPAAGGTYTLATCPEGAVVTQFDGRAGAFIDALGIECATIRLVVPEPPRGWWRNPVVVSLLAALVTVFLYILMSLSMRGSALLVRWVPALAVSASTAGAMVDQFAKSLGIDRPLFLGFMLAGFVAITALAIPFPALVRALASVPPFHVVLPIALKSRKLRRRIFAGYMDRLSHRLEREASDANQEQYVTLPAEIVDQQGMRQVEDPVAALKKLLTAPAPDGPPRILLEAGGGRGKSAIMRRLVQLCVDEFRNGAEIAIPVLCDLQGRTWEEIVGFSLGAYRLSDEAFAALICSGDFLLFADGMSESSATPIMFRTFTSAVAGQSTAMVIASRPEPMLSAVVRDCEHWFVVHPLLIAEDRLPDFASRYLTADGRPIAELDHALIAIRRTCKTQDKNYAPILVRLAIKAYSTNPDARNLATIYEGSFEAIVRKSSNISDDDYARLRAAAVQFAVDTYWKEGSRIGSGLGGDPAMFGLIGRLRKAGVLIDAPAGRLGRSVEELRFFHDSIQSYFAAVGLTSRNRDEWPAIMIRAAGAPEFAKDRSDLFGYGSSELFGMCVEILGSTCIDILEGMLSNWAEQYDGALVRDDLAENLPQFFREVHDRAVSVVGMSAGVYIKSVLAQLRNLQQDREWVAAALFAVVAPAVTPKSSMPPPSASSAGTGAATSSTAG